MKSLTPVKTVNQVKAPAPTLSDGHDAAYAKELRARYKDAQTGLRRVVNFGLLAWEIKETKLKHGQFGSWLAAHVPELTMQDSKSGKAKPSVTLNTYMHLTKGVLEGIGFTVGKYLEHISNSQQLRICHGGKYLLAADKKLPEEARQLKEKICELIDGKTQKQLLLEFKQVEDTEAEAIKAKRGNLSGKGCTKAARERAALVEEEARLTELTLSAEDTSKWLLENADHQRIGMLPDKTFSDLLTACETALAYMRPVAEARRSTKGQA